MKKKIFLFKVLVFVSLIGCKENKKGDTVLKEHKVVFKIDERIEFFRTAFNIALQNELPEDLKPCETEYLQRVNNQFIPYKEHPFINWIYNSENIGIDFSTIGLMFEDFKDFKFDKTYSNELKQYGLTEKILDSVRPLIEDFYQKTEFEKFFKNNEEYYKKAISQIENQVSDEKLFNKMIDFYQKEMDLIVFVELTNNANNKAVPFYDRYNLGKRAMILANICELPNEVTKTNEILDLNNDIRGVLYHEISHLFTDRLLEENIGELNQYNSICEDCSDAQIKDKIDHLIVFPLQGLMNYRFNDIAGANDFYVSECNDIRKEIYQRLSKYRPEDKIPFEETYIDCIILIKESAF